MTGSAMNGEENVSVLGILSKVSKDNSLTTINDLKTTLPSYY